MSFMPRIPAILLALLLTAAVAPHGWAQDGQSSIPSQQFGELQSNVPGTYFHAEPGEETMEVIVWGAVVNRGRYQVPTGTDLGELMSLAGGPSLEARERSRNRKVTLTVSRKTPNGREIVYTMEGEQLVETDRSYPTLQERDIVTVRVTEWEGITIGRVFRFIGTLASMALVVDRVIN